MSSTYTPECDGQTAVGLSGEDLLDTVDLHIGGERLWDGAAQLLAPLETEVLQPEDILVIVGEPGLHKTAIARRLLRGTKEQERKKEGESTARAIFARGRMDELTTNLASMVGRVTRASKRAKSKLQTLLIDDFPAASEDEIADLVHSLRAMTMSGAAVVITMLPEAYQLVEELPEARVVRTGDLLYRLPYVEDDGVRAAWARTRGIPALVEALRRGGDPAGTRYSAALRYVVLSSLRSGLPAEERLVRLAMVLLGTGAFADLAACVKRVDGETLAYLADEAPFFGIDLIEEKFSCAGVNDAERLRDCYVGIRGIDILDDELLMRVCGVLMVRGDFERAALCCQLIASDELRCKCVLHWGVEFCLAGAIQLAKDGLALARRLYMSSEVGYEPTELALRAIEEKAHRLPSVVAAKGVLTQVDERRRAILQLLIAARRLDIGLKAMVKTVQASTESLSSTPEVAAIYEHLRAGNALLEGHPAEAMRCAPAGMPTGWPTTVPEAMLADDLRIASALLGEKPSEHLAPVYERARRTMEGSHSLRLMAYQRAVPEMLSLIAGGRSGGALDQAITRADIEGDGALEAVFSVFKCVDDLRAGNWLPVSVRATHAAVAARDTTCTYLRETCELLGAVAQALMGDVSYLVEMATRTDVGQSVPYDLARFLVTIYLGSQPIRIAAKAKGTRLPEIPQKALRMTALSSSSLSPDALWPVHVLANDCGQISTLLKLQLPAAWKRALGDANFGEGPHETETAPAHAGGDEARLSPASAPGQPMGEEGGEGASAIESHTVYLTMLGGFTAMLDGKPISQDRLRSRRCGEVLALLCVAPKHVMRRYEIVELLWPTLDFSTGNQRLYEALSIGRKALGGGRYGGYDPFVVSKSKGTVALNAEFVACDVDLFKRAADQAAEKEGLHEVVVEQASTARALYSGDLDSAILHDLDEALQLKDQLRYTFATAMVAGSRAAMATDRQQLAVQFAQDAHTACRTREDAIAALMEALCLASRSIEAREAYEQFSSYLITMTGMPPSRGLRDLAARLFPEGEGEAGGQA